MKFMEIVRANQETWRTISISLLGKMRGGKTNIATAIAKEYVKEGWEVRYAVAPPPEVAAQVLRKPCRSSGLLAIFDDMSFLYSNIRDPSVNGFLNTYSQVRHYAGIEDVIVVFIFHYLKAIPPFMREATIRVLTGPISKSEAKMLYQERFFDWRPLKKYRKVIREYVYNHEFKRKMEKKRPALVTDSTVSTITQIPLVEDYRLEKHLVYDVKNAATGKETYRILFLNKRARIRDRGKYFDIYYRHNGKEIRVAKIAVANYINV